jgi:membrane protease YdiL (CAAX protease family)
MRLWVLTLCPWLAVGAGIYGLHSAPLAFVFYHGFCLLAYALLGPKDRPEKTKTSAFPIVQTLVLAVAANLGTALIFRRFGHYFIDAEQMRTALTQLKLGPETFWWLFPYFAIVNPLAEELFWRRMIFGELRTRPGWSVGQAALVSGMLFGAWHVLVIVKIVLPWVVLPATIAVGVVGVVLAQLYHKHGRIRDVALLHSAVADLPLLVILWLA